MRRFGLVLLVVTGCIPGTSVSAECQGLTDARYWTEIAVRGRGCDSDECAHNLYLDFKEDGTYLLDQDDTSEGGSYACSGLDVTLGEGASEPNIRIEPGGQRLVYTTRMDAEIAYVRK